MIMVPDYSAPRPAQPATRRANTELPAGAGRDKEAQKKHTFFAGRSLWLDK